MHEYVIIGNKKKCRRSTSVGNNKEEFVALLLLSGYNSIHFS
jgi:hypothetical protein